MRTLIIVAVSLIFSLNSFSQFQTKYLSFEGTGDLIMNLGKYRIGTAIDIKFEVEGG